MIEDVQSRIIFSLQIHNSSPNTGDFSLSKLETKKAKGMLANPSIASKNQLCFNDCHLLLPLHYG